MHEHSNGLIFFPFIQGRRRLRGLRTCPWFNICCNTFSWMTLETRNQQDGQCRNGGNPLSSEGLENDVLRIVDFTLVWDSSSSSSLSTFQTELWKTTSDATSYGNISHQRNKVSQKECIFYFFAFLNLFIQKTGEGQGSQRDELSTLAKLAICSQKMK